jgi:hypothetical protein
VPKVDLNDDRFQDQFFALEKVDQIAMIKAFRKLKQLSWSQVYRDSGLKWESIGNDEFTIRITLKCRAIVRRRADEVQFMSLHPDHDSAYE